MACAHAAALGAARRSGCAAAINVHYRCTLARSTGARADGEANREAAGVRGGCAFAALHITRPTCRQRCKYCSPRLTTRLSSARRGCTTRYNKLCAAPARSTAVYVRRGTASGMQHHLLSTREHPCAPVRTRGILCAPARAVAHAWLQLAWLWHARRCGSAIAALHLPGRRRCCKQRSPLLATRVGDARGASSTCYNQRPAAAARSHCDVRNRLECGTCCAPVSTCGHVCARVAPCAQLLAPVRTRGCSWLDWRTRTDAGSSAFAALHLPGRRRRQQQRPPGLATRLGNARSASATLYNQLRAAPARSQRCAKSPGMRHLRRTREHACARVGTCGTLCAPARASAHAWLQLAELRHDQQCSSSTAALHLRGRRLRCEQRSPLLATRVGDARSASSTCYNQRPAAPARSHSDVRNRLECGTGCAPVSTCGTLCAAARASAHAWLQLAWLRHTHRSGSAVAGLHLSGRRRHCEQRSPRLATRLGSARRRASTMRDNQLRVAPARALCVRTRCDDVRNHLESRTCTGESARVTPCAHLLTPVRTRAKPSQLLRGAWPAPARRQPTTCRVYGAQPARPSLAARHRPPRAATRLTKERAQRAQRALNSC